MLISCTGTREASEAFEHPFLAKLRNLVHLNPFVTGHKLNELIPDISSRMWKSQLMSIDGVIERTGKPRPTIPRLGVLNNLRVLGISKVQ